MVQGTFTREKKSKKIVRKGWKRPEYALKVAWMLLVETKLDQRPKTFVGYASNIRQHRLSARKRWKKTSDYVGEGDKTII